RVPREQVFNATGIQFMQLNTLYQLCAMAWEKSPLLDCAETLLLIPDLFNYLFTGVAKSEFSIATTSQMYDPRKRTWAVEMLRQLDLPTHILPEIIPSGTVLGPLLTDLAKECDVASSVSVIAPACHDTGSAVAAVPAQGGDDWCYISSGTWSLMGVELNDPLINAKTLKYNYTNEGGVGGTIRFLKNIAGLWLIQELRRHWKKEGHDHTYGELTEMAGRARPLEYIIDPNYKPFLSPDQMPQKV